MSWFEAKGLNWAKSAIKEAVASIDKALDIQDENTGGEKSMQVEKSSSANTTSAGGAVRKQKLPGAANRERNNTHNVVTSQTSIEASSPTATVSSVTTISSPTSAAPLVSSTWGSFTGSFFENPNVQQTITAPPRTSVGSVGMHAVAIKSQSDLTTIPGAGGADSPTTHRPSITSTTTSDSVELLSPPISSSSEQQSPSAGANYADNNDGSASVETISATPTLESEVGNKDMCMSVSASLPDSIVIITEKEEYDKDEDSISYKTIVGESIDATENEESNINPAPTHFSNTIEQPANSTSCSPSQKMIISLEDITGSHHADSDSTQSFEDVQMHTSCVVSQYLEKAQTVSPASDDQTDPLNSKSNSSPHNSNDEMETTTSSDIEIISNPNGNGDSSSTNSLTRASPLKWKKQSNQGGAQTSSVPSSRKGHFRGPSEISILSEDSQSELDKLLHRISELSETLEARELRLLQLERQNMELQERNREIESMLETIKSNSGSIDNAEGYTQRLSALEKKFQASIRERDALRIQIKDLKEELQLKIPKEQLTESTIMIEELRLEGEKLSKDILQQSNIIKKLRTKEKTTDATLKKNKEEITSLSDELDRLKKTLNAKEEVERSQIEAVHKMSSEKRKLEDENAQLRSKLEDLQSKWATLQSSFEAAKSELQQRTRQHTDLTRTAEEAIAAKKERELLKTENEEILVQLGELREKLRATEQATVKREQQLREESKELIRRLEAAEMRAERTTQEASLTTVPLMRQLESLQNTLTQRTSNWNQEEKILLDKLAVAQSKLKSLESLESKYEERVELLQKRCSELEETLSHSLLQEEKAKMGSQQAQLEYSMKESGLKKELANLTKELEVLTSKVETLERKNKVLEEKLRTKAEEKAQSCIGGDNLTQTGGETQRIVSLSATTFSPHELARQQSLEQSHRSQSPAMSFGRNSPEETIEGGSIDWQAEDIDCISNSGRHMGNLAYGINMSFMGHNTSTLEHLQSMLKQRDGELVHIQWELARLQEGRSVLAEEIADLTTELEAAKEKLLSYESLEQNYEELQRNYDALLQMYGEKVERTEELELDLKEAREAYKTQIDELLAQPPRPT
ncbi:PREDICTED: TATA element modulatory factor isoform X1 [Rhagoletis zephyria]|uniref:TATA element modulatory factor isoform X1 n=1 Tax=Rhagoletis zephyria TaxID=28612 RepID=UPI0008119542|nr:PREDICTED: TATA element modulatory factor isoform X1 [Rhagoletis zephyria]